MADIREPLLIEIIAFAPAAYYHCTQCEVAWRAVGMTNRLHEEQVGASLPPDLAADYQAISDWVRELFRRYCDRLAVRVVDAASLEGFVKLVRYQVRRQPAVIVGRQARFTGDVHQALAAARQEIARRLSPADALATV
jgi:hypothetical protein